MTMMNARWLKMDTMSLRMMMGRVSDGLRLVRVHVLLAPLRLIFAKAVKLAILSMAANAGKIST